MTDIEPGTEEEKPLDPAMERVRRKMVRLQIVSGAVMFVSLMAVFGAVVYKTMRAPAPVPAASGESAVPSEGAVQAAIALPPGFAVQSTAFSGRQILFYGKTAEGAAKALIFDIGSGRMVGELSINGG